MCRRSRRRTENTALPVRRFTVFSRFWVVSVRLPQVAGQDGNRTDLWLLPSQLYHINPQHLPLPHLFNSANMPKDAAPEVMPELDVATLFGVKGKVALVTGGATGLGKMISAAFIRNGAKVYIASRKFDDIKRVAEQLSALSPKGAVNGPACIGLQADVGSKAGCEALAQQIKDKEQNLDILVNNAGITWGAPLDDFPEEKGWDKIFHLNVKSQFYLTVALLPLLEKGKSNTKHASVINIASVAAISPMATTPLAPPGSGTWSYQPSKAASVHLTRTLANSLSERFVLVNAILPGVFPSRMTAYGLEQGKDLFDAGQPTGRIGSPEDIGSAALYFASRAGAHTTGVALVLDGGQTLQWSPRM
ncbi:hypothetical protein CF319_g1554 [Tilletia indica]|nr:hypothetical protein CF319_g1554 [Tilletia indica]